MNTTCLVCGTEMDSRRENRAYSPRPGVESVTLKNILVLHCPSCGEEEIEIPKIHQLHRTIAKRISSKEGRLLPAEIRFLRSYLGWSGSDFARQFEVSRETVSRWENDKQPMGPTAEKLLRMYALYIDPMEEEEQQPKKQEEVQSPVRVQMELIDGEWEIPIEAR